MVVRSDFKGDLKLGNKMNIYDCMDAKHIKVFFRSTIKEMNDHEVVLADARSGEEKARLENDFIFALIGSERPTKEPRCSRWAFRSRVKRASRANRRRRADAPFSKSGAS